jgi:Ricin-type beta-trefoil lectin domain
MLRPRSVIRLVALATLVVPLMLFAVSAAEAQPHTKALSTASSGAAAFPPGTPGPFMIVNQSSGLCLDYGNQGNYVYQGVCNSTDAGQRWGWFNGGWLINLARDKCAVDTLSGIPIVSLATCDSSDPYQYWRHQNYMIVNGYTGRCMEPGDSDSGTKVYSGSCVPRSSQRWSVWYW